MSKVIQQSILNIEWTAFRALRIFVHMINFLRRAVLALWAQRQGTDCCLDKTLSFLYEWLSYC